MTFVGWVVVLFVGLGAGLIVLQLVLTGLPIVAAATALLGVGITLTAFKAHRSAVSSARLLREHRREVARTRALLVEMRRGLEVAAIEGLDHLTARQIHTDDQLLPVQAEAVARPAGTEPEPRPRLARGFTSIALNRLLERDQLHLLHETAERIDLTGLDASTAKRVAVVLRRAGDLSVSTRLADHILSRRPDDAAAKRLAEVGRSGLDVLADGWPIQPPRHRPSHSRPNTVAYLLHNSLPYASAGYATRTHGLLSALVRDGWETHAVTRLGYPYDVWGLDDNRTAPAFDLIDDVSYNRLLDGKRAYLKWPIGEYVRSYAFRVGSLVRQRQIGIIHGASNYWNGLAAVTAARQLGLPSIYEVRGLWELTRISREPSYEGSEMFRLTAQLEASACEAADHVLTITNALRAEMVARGVPENKISVLPNGVDTARFHPRSRDPELAAKLRLSEKVVIGYLGSVLDYEGIDILLEAAARLRRRRGNDFHLLVVGDGAAYDECIHLRDRLGIADVATFTGRIPHHEIERYYSLVDIAPFPRKPLPVCEAVSPLKPFEAMAMGKVPVVSNVAALAEIISHEQNGLVFTKGDVDSLTSNLDRLIDDPHLRRRLGTAARQWVVRERDWAVVVKHLEQIYAAVSAGSPERRLSA